MSNQEMSLIWQTMRRDNVLPLTSRCNTLCIFCSNRQNPPGIQVVNIALRSRAEVCESLDLLDPAKKIIIGESATGINEGEPLTHPDFWEIMEELRQHFPQTPLQITTNGILLNRERVALLQQWQPLELYLSLNAVSVMARQNLMGNGAAVTRVPQWLARVGVPFHGSLVAVPWITGWEELNQTVELLDAMGARSIRVMAPGFTRLTPPQMHPPVGLYCQLADWITTLKVMTPVILEPARPRDLIPEVAGVMLYTPAKLAGVAAGDVVLAVDGQQVFSRVDAWQRVQTQANPRLRIQRQGEVHELTLSKQAHASSGLIMHYDWDPRRARDLVRQVTRRRCHRLLVLASAPARTLIESVLDQILPETVSWSVAAVQAAYFGGNITAAGLLTVADWEKAYQELQDSWDLILIPANALDDQGRDLTGRHYLDMDLGVEVVPV